MKHFLLFICLLYFIFSPSAAHTEEFGSLYTRLIEGDVLVKTLDSTEWVPASINMPLWSGDTLWTPDNARAELLFGNGSIIRINEMSHLEPFISKAGNFGFRLAMGRLYGNINPENVFPLMFETPTASFTVHKQSIIMVNISQNKDTDLIVLRGEVYVDSPSGEIKVISGQRIFIRDDYLHPEYLRINSSDPWQDWNAHRDKEIFDSQGTQTNYLPDELDTYSADLNRNGKWVYETEYGWVWTPAVIVASNWSPYRIGRWVWIRGDYIWISYEPWGWIPYHYGRWAFLRHRGWCWVPPSKGGDRWAAGYVAWVNTPEYVAWVPLAPHEPYIGYGRFAGKRGMEKDFNNGRDFPYKNIHINNAVTTVQRSGFLSGKHSTAPIKENPFFQKQRVMSPPDVKPGKAAMMPIVKPVLPAKLPPQKIISEAFRYTKKNVPSQNSYQKIAPQPAVSDQTGDITSKNTTNRSFTGESINVRPLKDRDNVNRFGKKTLPSPNNPAALAPIVISPLTKPTTEVSTPIRQPAEIQSIHNRNRSDIKASGIPEPQLPQTTPLQEPKPAMREIAPQYQTLPRQTVTQPAYHNKVDIPTANQEKTFAPKTPMRVVTPIQRDEVQGRSSLTSKGMNNNVQTDKGLGVKSVGIPPVRVKVLKPGEPRIHGDSHSGAMQEKEGPQNR